MKVSQNISNMMQTTNAASQKNNFTQKISQDEAVELKAQIEQNSNNYVLESLKAQNIATGKKATSESDFTKDYQDFQAFLKDVGYTGKPIAELSKEEASALVADDGIFGIERTAKRIAEFVINGSGGDEAKMRAGREGMLRGFAMAEEMWGGKLPEISQTTMKNATEMVDKAMADFGFSLIDKEV